MPFSIPQVGAGVTRSRIAARWREFRQLDLAGIHGGASAYLLNTLQREDGRPMVVVEKDARSAALMAENLAFFSASGGDGTADSDILLFPAYEMGPYDEVVPDKSSELRRTALLFRLLPTHDLPYRFLVIPGDALQRRVAPRETFGNSVHRLRIGDTLHRDRLVALLTRGGYHHTPVVEEPGTYTVRGALVDVFVPYLDAPVRLDFFGDEIDRIDVFDPGSQGRTGSMQEIWIHPARQALLPETTEEMDAVERRLRAVCDSVNYPTAQTELLIQDMMDGRTFVGSHSFLPAMTSHLDSLFAYLGDVTYALCNPAGLRMGWHRSHLQANADYDRKRSLSTPAFPPDTFHCASETITDEILAAPRVQIHALEVMGETDGGAEAAVTSYLNPATVGFVDLRQRLRVLAEQQGSLDVLDALAQHLVSFTDEGYRTVLVTHSHGQSDRLVEMLGHRDVEVQQLTAMTSATSHDKQGEAEMKVTPAKAGVQRALESQSVLDSRLRGNDGCAFKGDFEQLPGPGVYLCEGELASGFVWPAEGICVIAEEEIFGKSALRKRAKSTAKDVFFDITSLKPGDLVVHKEHGVGRYEGLVHQEVRDVGMDFLLITYRGDDKLYLPVYRLSQVQKYQSGSEKLVGLDKLGGATFTKTKAAARKRAMLLAAKLLDIYARKALTTRRKVDAVDDLYLAFESGFPYEETPDQLAVITEVMTDLESDRPMDRLLCGDVGFGKTEVALRGAFRVVNSGRQVAVLVPTTVLAQQHYLTFKQRFANYPVRVEMLSRFRTKGQNANVVLGVKDGAVDIVVGTHRLLSGDVHFKNLGLLVIDEEHRFGVAHKERIRSLRTTVDTLAMTATPIPRTLHMAFSKLRDLSIISTPPVNRLPIKTMICHDDSDLVREAIEREMARDGQVYFVHNRVRDIAQVADRIAHLVPAARVGVGHGQMKEDALERVMRDFIDGRYDVLVSTAIIESGLDIPRANTIMIDRADTFGLAQLYQIRGRVGRSDVQAYAYLMVPPLEMLGDEAKERVEALAMHTELGSGFQVASMDLEIRGAGDLLGAEQSGDVNGVGFEMYMDLLEEATARLKGEDYEVAYEPEINLEMPGFLPADYMADVGLRLHFYKELATSRTEEDVNQIAAALVDRFGKLPSETVQLIDGMVARALARQLGVLGVETTNKKVTIHLGSQAGIRPQTVIDLVQSGEGAVRLTKDFKIIAVRESDKEIMTHKAIGLLRKLRG
ncbi:MAG: transcription-repair coupling factor [Deltaproteobacteria bacterium]|nr:transcription-repair coupling factor [Deltaproteobacteria bacterium]